MLNVNTLNEIYRNYAMEMSEKLTAINIQSLVRTQNDLGRICLHEVWNCYQIFAESNRRIAQQNFVFPWKITKFHFILLSSAVLFYTIDPVFVLWICTCAGRVQKKLKLLVKNTIFYETHQFETLIILAISIYEWNEFSYEFSHRLTVNYFRSRGGKHSSHFPVKLQKW